MKRKRPKAKSPKLRFEVVTLFPEALDSYLKASILKRAIEDGYLQGLIADEAYKIHQEVESGERPVVGVNKFVTAEAAPDIDTYELDAEGRDLQLKRLAQVKAERDPAAVSAALAALSRGAEGDENLMHRLIDCANAYCTVGEMVSTLKAVWGEFQQPVVF